MSRVTRVTLGMPKARALGARMEEEESAETSGVSSRRVFLFDRCLLAGPVCECRPRAFASNAGRLEKCAAVTLAFRGRRRATRRQCPGRERKRRVTRLPPAAAHQHQRGERATSVDLLGRPRPLGTLVGHSAKGKRAKRVLLAH